MVDDASRRRLGTLSQKIRRSAARYHKASIVVGSIDQHTELAELTRQPLYLIDHDKAYKTFQTQHRIR